MKLLELPNHVKMLLQIQLTFLSLLGTITAYLDLQSNYFSKTRFSRLQTTFEQQTVPSSINCTALCSQNVKCESVNYHPGLGICQLSEVTGNLLDGDTTADIDWNVYSRRTGRCHSNCCNVSKSPPQKLVECTIQTLRIKG